MWYLSTALVVLSTIFIVESTLTKEQTTLLASHRKDCLAKSSVGASVVEKIHKGNLEDNPKVKAYAVCFLKHLGMLDDTGAFQKYIMSAKIAMALDDNAKAEKITETCAVSKSSVEETAFEAIKCLYGQEPKIAVILA